MRDWSSDVCSSDLIREHVQREFPAVFAFFLRRLTRGLDDIVRQAGEFGFVTDVLGKGIGGVE